MQIDVSNFEEFKAPSGRTTPFVTLDSMARIYISSAAAKVYEINDKKYPAVKLYYSKQDNVLAIKLLSEAGEGSLPLKSPAQGGAFINGKSFAIRYEMMNGDKLSDNYKGKYFVEKGGLDGIGEVFLINLNEKKK